MLHSDLLPNHWKLCQNFVEIFTIWMFLKIAFAVLPGHSSFKQVSRQSQQRKHELFMFSKIVGVQPSSLYHLVELVTVCQNLGDLCSKYAGYS